MGIILEAFKGKIKLTRVWNSGALFVVFGAKIISTSQQTDIINAFSKFRIYNSIIVSQVHYVMEKENIRHKKVNDVVECTILHIKCSRSHEIEGEHLVSISGFRTLY